MSNNSDKPKIVLWEPKIKEIVESTLDSSIKIDEFVNELDSKIVVDVVNSEDDSSFFWKIQVRQSINKLEEELTPREKEVFQLQKQEYTTREIGKRLEISHVRVVKIQHNIRKKAHAVI